jgi:hypothetical protein
MKIIITNNLDKFETPIFFRVLVFFSFINYGNKTETFSDISVKVMIFGESIFFAPPT